MQTGLIQRFVRAAVALLAVWLLLNLIRQEIPVADKAVSLLTGRPVADMIREHGGFTLLNLGKGILAALPLALLFGVPAGLQPGSAVDRVLQAPVAILMGIPATLVGLWSILTLGINARGLVSIPTAGFIGLALAMVPWLARAIRDGVQGRSLLLPAGRVLQQMGTLLIMVLVYEMVAASPGMLRLLITALTRRDAVVVLGVVTWVAYPTVLIHLAGDLLTLPQREGVPAGKPSWAWLVGGGVLLLVLLTASVLTFENTLAINFLGRNLPPGGEHMLGTDDLGRDVVALLAAGSRTSLTIAFLATGLAAIAGAIVGAIAGVTGRIGAAILSPRVQAPALFGPIIACMGLSLATRPSIYLLIAVIGFTAVPASAYAMRRLVQEPAKLGPLLGWLGTLALIFAQGLMVEGILGFFGLSVAPPVPSLGNVLGGAMPYLRRSPHLLIPGWAAAAGMAGLFLIGFALRDAAGEPAQE